MNKEATSIISEPTTNYGEDDGAVDFRYKDNLYVSKLSTLYKVMKFIPGYKLLNKFLSNFVVNQKFKSKKFFDN